MYLVRKNNLRTTICFIFAIFCIITMLLHPEAVTEGAIKGLKTSATTLIPSLFPLTALTLFAFATSLPDKLLKNNLIIALFIASFLGGYPTGSIVLKNAVKSGKISHKAASRLVCSFINAGPAFILITVGRGVLGNNLLGLILLSATIISSVLIFLMVGAGIKEKIIYKESPVNLSDAFVNSVYQAVGATINICGYVILFTAVFETFMGIKILDQIIKNMSPLLEVTNGILSSDKNIYVIAFLLGFSGFCVHLQIFSNTSEFMPKIWMFYFFRVLHGTLNVIFSKIIIIAFGVSVKTISNNVEFISGGLYTSVIQAISLVILSFALIISIYQKVSVEKRKLI